MRFVIQRVKRASVSVEEKVVGKIDKGFMVLIGISQEDNKEIADKMVKKLINLRVFTDENDKMNLDINSVNGELLLVSQFTLYANCKEGNRPAFIEAAKPDLANELYEYIISECKNKVNIVQSGIFGAKMEVDLVNDGPVTIILDSEKI